MVQLSSRYDSTLKKKVFILKGDEAYARTTEVLANLITFDDFDNHIHYCHVGLEIEVLRELGESYLYIYNNDEMLYDVPIPYNDSGMAEIIDSEWNEKGVYWINNKLVIGKKSENPLVNTGLYLPYDVENKIRVEYIGNKHCLSSESKPIPLIVPTPDTFESTLTLQSNDPSYSPSATVNDVQLLFECENETENSKTVKIYDNDNLVTTETVMQDVPVTLTLGELSDGLHILKAVFEGDDEAYASETSYSISVGYKITNLTYPSYVVQGNAGTLSCTILDYLDNPVYDEGVAVMEYVPNWGWEAISQTDYPSSDGTINIDLVYYSTRPFAVAIGQWTGSEHTMDIINPTSISLELNNPITLYTESNAVTGTVMDSESSPVSGIRVNLELLCSDGSRQNYQTTTDSNGNYSMVLDGEYPDGVIGVTSSVIGSSVSSETIPWNRVVYWWSSTMNKFLGVARGMYSIISRKSNGFELSQTGENTASIVFNGTSYSQYNSCVDRYEFKIVNKGNGTAKIFNWTLNELGVSNGDIIDARIVYRKNLSSQAQVLVNGEYVEATPSYPNFQLDITIPPNGAFMINQLVGQRVSVE